MVDIKRKLLIFLYEHRHSMQVIPINDVFKNSGHRDIDIRNLLKDLKKNDIIKLNNDYWALATSLPPRGGERFWNTIENTPISAKLTHVKGEQFVREHYLKSDQPTITANQLFYAHGDINGPINQSNNHSSNISNIEATQKQKKATSAKIINFLFWLIGGISALIGIYQWLKTL